MHDFCRACGGVLDRLDGEMPYPVKNWLMLADVPDWLNGLCVGCLMEIDMPMNENRTDYIGPPTPGDVLVFLAEKLREAANRQADRRSLRRCEAIESRFVDVDHQCRRYASRERDGRAFCFPHWKAQERGQKVAVVGDGHVAPRLISFWARSAEEAKTESVGAIARVFE